MEFRSWAHWRQSKYITKPDFYGSINFSKIDLGCAGEKNFINYSSQNRFFFFIPFGFVSILDISLASIFYKFIPGYVLTYADAESPGGIFNLSTTTHGLYFTDRPGSSVKFHATVVFWSLSSHTEKIVSSQYWRRTKYEVLMIFYKPVVPGLRTLKRHNILNRHYTDSRDFQYLMHNANMEKKKIGSNAWKITKKKKKNVNTMKTYWKLDATILNGSRRELFRSFRDRTREWCNVQNFYWTNNFIY